MIRRVARAVGQTFLVIGFIAFGYDAVASLMRSSLVATRLSDLLSSSKACNIIEPIRLFSGPTGFDDPYTVVFAPSPLSAVLSLWVAPTCLFLGMCLVSLSSTWLRRLPRRSRKRLALAKRHTQSFSSQH